MSARFALLLLTAGAGLATPATGSSPEATFPHALLRWSGGSGEAEFHVVGDVAVLTLRAPDGSATPLRAVTDVHDALAILADERLSFAWPALLNWAGADLTRLRDLSLARSRSADEVGLFAAPPQGSERWTGDAGLAATLQYVRALVRAGRKQEALALLRRRLTAAPRDRDASHVRAFLSVRLANILFDGREEQAAINTLEQAARDPLMSPDFKLNVDVNLAMLLARHRDHPRALVIITAAWREFDGEAEQVDVVKVPDSAANFAWIKACALNGLGRHDEARKLLDGIGDPTSLDDSLETSAATTARSNGLLCMGDAHGLSVELARRLATAPPAGGIFLEVQPTAQAYAPDAALTAAAVRDPVLARAMVGRVRSLAPRFAAALSRWPAAATRPDGG